MRLIDADALRDRFQNLTYDDWNQGAGTTWANAFSEAADIVEEQPTADAVERKRGKWITEYDRWGKHIKTVRGHKCSICNHYLDFDGVNAGRGDANFCPFCGADMRKETEDAEVH